MCFITWFGNLIFTLVKRDNTKGEIIMNTSQSHYIHSCNPPLPTAQLMLHKLTPLTIFSTASFSYLFWNITHSYHFSLYFPLFLFYLFLTSFPTFPWPPFIQLLIHKNLSDKIYTLHSFAIISTLTLADLQPRPHRESQSTRYRDVILNI